MVVLTWNEEANIGRCLGSLAAQTDRDFEVLVIDAASQDRTTEIVRALQEDFPVPLHLEAFDHRIPVGAARNLGVQRTRGPYVVYLSADAEFDPDWIERARVHLETADMVYGHQVHAPDRWSVGAAVRALRYQFPDRTPEDPVRYASNVAAAYRKTVLEAIPFDRTTALDDVVLAVRAQRAGYRAVYDPNLIVRHHDVSTAREEMRKVTREGRGWGDFAGELGLFTPLVTWGVGLLIAIALVALRPGILTLAFLALMVWAPALRRAFQTSSRLTPWQRLKGVAASPPFDLALLLSYLRGLFTPHRPEATHSTPKET